MILGGKADGGSSDILPEIEKVCYEALLEFLVKLFGESNVVPQIWVKNY